MRQINKLLSITLILFTSWNLGFSAQSELFPIIKKDVACTFEDGFYVWPNNGSTKSYPSQKVEYLLEIKGFPNWTVAQWFLKNWSTLSYIVTDISWIWKSYSESYYLYTYNCKTKQVKKILSDISFQKIVQKTNHPKLYTPYQVLWYDKEFITIRLDMNWVGCNDSLWDCSSSEYYEVHIQSKSKTYTLIRRNTGNERKINEWTFKY